MSRGSSRAPRSARLLSALAALAALTGVTPARLAAQGGIAFEVGRLFTTSPDWTSYRIGTTRPLRRPARVHGLRHACRRAGAGGGSLWGIGANLSLFRGGRPGAYLSAGLAGGLATGGGDRFWRDWSAGLGYEVRPLDFLAARGRGALAGAELWGAARRTGIRRDAWDRLGRPGTRTDARVPAEAGSATAPATGPDRFGRSRRPAPADRSWTLGGAGRSGPAHHQRPADRDRRDGNAVQMGRERPGGGRFRLLRAHPIRLRRPGRFPAPGQPGPGPGRYGGGEAAGRAPAQGIFSPFPTAAAR